MNTGTKQISCKHLEILDLEDLTQVVIPEIYYTNDKTKQEELEEDHFFNLILPWLCEWKKSLNVMLQK